MQCGKSILISFVVDPLVNLLLGDSLNRSLHQFRTDLFQIFKASHVHEGVAPVVDNIH